jgi:hypothetical protein
VLRAKSCVCKSRKHSQCWRLDWYHWFVVGYLPLAFTEAGSSDEHCGHAVRPFLHRWTAS